VKPALPAAGAAALLVVGGLAISAASAGPAEVAAERRAQAGALLSVVESPIEAKDGLPAGFDPSQAGDGGLDVGTARIIGANSVVSVWGGLDVHANPCVITELTESGTVSTACTTLDQFQQRGLSQAVLGSAGDYTEVYLVEDGSAVRNLPAGLTTLGMNLIVGDSRGTAQTELSVLALSGAIQVQIVHPAE